jgi:hypothetical protein
VHDDQAGEHVDREVLDPVRPAEEDAHHEVVDEELREGLT